MRERCRQKNDSVSKVERRRRRRPPLPVVAEPHQRLLTARQGAWLVVRREEQRTQDDAQQLAQLRTQHADVAEAIDLAQDFTPFGQKTQTHVFFGVCRPAIASSMS